MISTHDITEALYLFLRHRIKHGGLESEVQVGVLVSSIAAFQRKTLEHIRNRYSITHWEFQDENVGVHRRWMSQGLVALYANARLIVLHVILYYDSLGGSRRHLV